MIYLVKATRDKTPKQPSMSLITVNVSVFGCEFCVTFENTRVKYLKMYIYIYTHIYYVICGDL